MPLPIRGAVVRRRVSGTIAMRMRTSRRVMVAVHLHRARVEERVRTLDNGADDYLLKPFSFSELSARVRALLRRGRASSDPLLSFADLTLDRMERSVERGGKRIELTTKLR